VRPIFAEQLIKWFASTDKRLTQVCSQFPGVLMIAFYIGLHRVGAMLDHLKIRVAKRILQRHHLASVSEVLGRKCMSKPMWVGVGDARASFETANESPQGVTRHGACVSVVNGEQVTLWFA
jgi:hypothetical protein